VSPGGKNLLDELLNTIFGKSFPGGISRIARAMVRRRIGEVVVDQVVISFLEIKKCGRKAWHAVAMEGGDGCCKLDSVSSASHFIFCWCCRTRTLSTLLKHLQLEELTELEPTIC
jgi:hypothetical protein